VKLVLELPCGTVTLAGTDSAAVLELEMPMTRLLAAFADIVMVQLLVEPTAILVGAQVTEDRVTGAMRLIAAICELLPRVAVTIALWLPAKEAAAVALKVAVLAPTGTVTEAGTVSETLLLAKVTLEPPVGAAWVRVTVQVPTALGPRLAGLQATLETRTGASRLIVAVFELLPRVEVMVAV